MVTNRRYALLVFFHLGQGGSDLPQNNTKSILSHSVIWVINRIFVSDINKSSLCGNHALHLSFSFTDMERMLLSWEKTRVYSHDRPSEP